MSRIIARPNLPDSSVVLAAIGERYFSRLEKAFDKQGIELISIPSNNSLDNRLCGHIDLSLLHVGFNSLISDPDLSDEDAVKRLESEGFSVEHSDEKTGNEYPQDCHLNVCIIDNHYVCKNGIVSKKVVLSLNEQGLQPVFVNQGYSKCCTGICNSSSVITSDRGIAETLIRNDFNVLLIEPGGIILDGFSYGFIGGASFLIDRNKICFTGDFRYFAKESENKILSFLDAGEIDHTFLTDEPIFDIGGIVQLKEA